MPWVAESLAARLAGLAWLRRWPDGHALLLPCCRSVHTVGMRFPIDVAFVSWPPAGGACEVVALEVAVPPLRVVAPRALPRRSVAAIEAGAHVLRGLGVVPGAGRCYLHRVTSARERWVHLYEFGVGHQPGAGAWAGLSEDELVRAARILDPARRSRFVARRAALSTILARYAGRPVCFNSADSGDVAAVAVAARPVGVDIEIDAPRRQEGASPQRMFAPDERSVAGRGRRRRAPASVPPLLGRQGGLRQGAGAGACDALRRVLGRARAALAAGHRRRRRGLDGLGLDGRRQAPGRGGGGRRLGGRSRWLRISSAEALIRQNIEAIKRGYDAVGQGNFDGMLDLVDPDVVMRDRPESPDPAHLPRARGGPAGAGGQRRELRWDSSWSRRSSSARGTT